MRSAPPATEVALVATLAVTAGAVGAFTAGFATPQQYLNLFTLLFALRVLGQLVVLVCAPRWLPPMGDWNFVPYGVLLPIQLALLGVMTELLRAPPHPRALLVVAAFLYWGAMLVRYVVRIARVEDKRWFRGAIPIVFHCVLASFLCVLGAAPGNP